HSSIVARGVQRALVVADLPFMSYHVSPEEGLRSAGRLMQETGVAAVKLEGGVRAAETIERVVRAEIPVMGHIGLTPQSFHRMGGHKVQGRNDLQERRLKADAKAVESAGAFAIVLEGMPSEVAAEITDSLAIPTIGIGAGPQCSGQVLVMHDLLGITPLRGETSPKFVKAFAGLRETVIKAANSFVAEVREGSYPDQAHSYSRRSRSKTALRSVT
ncbi:MAG: 3-methyl-2-oxobutanoate hydroxymethyltransferase, partial [Bdellovibrionales bacterium]|nr:3-methyl-2-oxobutanoate hydroxymethyltransferase [Bdellovibrionales bacterium]